MLDRQSNPCFSLSPLLLPRSGSVGSIFHNMRDTPDETLHATFNGGPPDDMPRPTTPVPDPSRALRRTASYASIDTVRPSGNKGIRRRIEEIAENLKRKSTKRKKLTLNILKNTPRNAEYNPATPPGSKAARCVRTTTPPLRSFHGSEEKSTLSTSDSDHGTVHQDPELDPALMPAVCNPDPSVDVLLFKGEGGVPADYALPVRSLQPGAHFTTGPDTPPSPRTPKIIVKDLKLDIRSSQTDITIWDGLQAPHHMFKCRLFLCCIAHPYDSVPLPDIRCVEMDCNTRPAGSRYARPPVLQVAYQGAAPGPVKKTNGPPNVSLAAGIHMDRAWYKIQNNDGTWGWYRDAFVPLSSRLFDKVDYREFKLISRVWMGESCIEDELTFGISMLLRGVDMK